ncbi:MAG: hypothetical protein LBH53_03235 [Puniceicoccales bacterium]|jgi:hypothetical protein|nr:hypothetical protein [Puniceicoccales bacterium]
MALIDDALRKERRGAPVAGFFSMRRRPLGLLLVAAVFLAGCYATVFAIRLTFGRDVVASPAASTDRQEEINVQEKEESAATEEPAFSPMEQVLRMTIQGVQVGPYETKALIDGRMVRQGERVGPLIFLGMRGKELAFEDGTGEKYYRPICPPDRQ